VNTNRHISQPGPGQLCLECRHLEISRTSIAIVIQADLTHRHDLRRIKQLLHFFALLIEASSLMRMDAHGCKHDFIAICQIDGSEATGQVCSNCQNAIYASLLGPFHDCRAITVESSDVEMGVSVWKQNSPPYVRLARLPWILPCRVVPN
jgi:hypothetical protein